MGTCFSSASRPENGAGVVAPLPGGVSPGSGTASLSNQPSQNPTLLPSGISALGPAERATSSGSSGGRGAMMLEKVIPLLYNSLQNSIHAVDATAGSLAESLQEAPPELRDQVSTDLAEFSAATRNTHALVNDLLILMRLKLGSLVPAPDVVCVRQQLKEALERVRPMLRAPVTITVAPDVPSLLVIDAALLLHVLTDALMLAARHCEPQSSPGGKSVSTSSSSSSGSAASAAIHVVAYRPSGAGRDGFMAAQQTQSGSMMSRDRDRDAMAGAGAGSLGASRGLHSQSSNGAGLSAPSAAAAMAAAGGAGAGAGIADAPLGGGPGAPLPPGRQLCIEVLDTGTPLGTANAAELLRALETGQQVRGARAQRTSLFLPIASMLAESMGGRMELQELRLGVAGTSSGGSASAGEGYSSVVPPASLASSSSSSARVVRFCVTLPYTLPSEPERARAAEELAVEIAEETVGIAVPPLPWPFAAASGATIAHAGGAGVGAGAGASATAGAAAARAGVVSGLGGGGSTGGGDLVTTVPPTSGVLSPLPEALAPLRQSSANDAVGTVSGTGASRDRRSPAAASSAAGGVGSTSSTGTPVVPRPGGAAGAGGGSRAVVGLDGEPLRMHVLLVDDMRVIRRQGELFLEQLGCTCITLEDGDEVESALRASPRPFDAIVLDIIMSRSDGALVCRTLREALGVRCPIIAMTGNTSSKDLQRYYAMGFDVVLPKPFTREAIGRALVEGRERCVHTHTHTCHLEGREP